MNDVNLLGPWVRRFLLEHLIGERNLARNTQRSYRDTLSLLLPFVSGQLNRAVDRLTIVDVSADLVRLFLLHLEESRECGIATRNQRLAAVYALARFIGEHSPEHVQWCGQLRAIPCKKIDEACCSVSGKTRDGRTAVLPQSSNRARPPRLYPAVVPLQFR